MSETTTTVEKKAHAPRLDVPIMKNKGGRPAHGVAEAGVQQSIDALAPKALQILKDHIEYKRRSSRRMEPSVQRACEYVIDHAIGKSRQKIEHSGGILTYGSLAKDAEAMDKKPRELLADVEEIAGKRDRMLAVQDAIAEDNATDDEKRRQAILDKEAEVGKGDDDATE
jgi:hypothetical protein